MRLYEIDPKIEELTEQMIDAETGEVNEDILKQIQELQMEKQDKIESIACYVKDLKAYLLNLKAEKESIEAKSNIAEKKVERLTNVLYFIMPEKNFSTSKVEINKKITESTIVDDKEAMLNWAEKNAPELINRKVNETKEIFLNKTKKLIESETIEVPFAHIEKNYTVGIK